MGRTFAEKALAKHAGLVDVEAGSIVEVTPNVVLSHDNSAAIAGIFQEMGGSRVFDPDMHAIVLALPFLLFSIYFLEIKKYRLFIASATLLVLCKEDMPLVLLMLGIWHGLRSKDVKTGAIISAAAAI